VKTKEEGVWERSPQKLDIYKQFDIDLASEFNHIKDWVAGSHLKLTLIRPRILCYARARYFHVRRSVYPKQPRCYFYSPSQLFPSLHIPPFPSRPPAFPLLLVLPFFPLLSRSGPLETSRGLGERCKFPQWGLGRSPSRHRFLCILREKKTHLTAIIIWIFVY